MTTFERDCDARTRRLRFVAAMTLMALAFAGPTAGAQGAVAGAAPAGWRHALDENPFASMTDRTPRRVPNLAFIDDRGAVRRLEQFRGKLILLNVWATWCPPCRREMPTLERLQARLGGPAFEVVALSIDKGGRAAVESFFDEIDVKALKVYVDPTTAVRNDLALTAFPTTLLIDRQGREIGRYTGGADWDSPPTVAMLRRYLAARTSAVRDRIPGPPEARGSGRAERPG
ncbi:MAG TPA: TlpA disulfide reductase family protein [Casimicrobiaceae bacterium]|nr:TlpA disulfide reductase family protein [Casimicrobiaceae bacterium]